MAAPIYCWESDGCAWIRVTGEASFQNAAEVKEFGKQMIRKGIRDFVVDLAECTLLDSTFMGTMAGIALRLRECGGFRSSLRIVHVSSEHDKVLRDLGLDQIFGM